MSTTEKRPGDDISSFNSIGLEVVRNLERLNTQTDQVLERLKKMNGSLGDHERSIIQNNTITEQLQKDIGELKGQLGVLQGKLETHASQITLASGAAKASHVIWSNILALAGIAIAMYAALRN